MWQGTLLAIHVAPAAEAAMRSVPEARAVPGLGLEGDRYFAKAGTYSKKDRPDREVTLVEREALDALRREHDRALPAELTRRNLLTEGAPLNHLVGREFAVGEAVLRGLRLCEPCGHMARLAGMPGVDEGLVHRGGLRAQVVRGGVLRVGDAVRPQPV